MTEAIGGGAPLPPKRPTIIRPQVVTSDADGGTETSARKVPSRPAPPPPARPAPPQIKVSQQDQDSDGDVIPRRIVPAPERSSSPRRSAVSVRKRPEITIIGARPMSQVGFRDEMHKGTSETEHQTPPPTVKPPDIPHMRQPPPRPVSMGRPPPRSAMDDDCPDNIPPPSISPVSPVSPKLQPLRPSRPKSWASDRPVPQARKSPSQPDHDNTENQAPSSQPSQSPTVSPQTQQHNFEDSGVKSSSEVVQQGQEEQRKQPPRPSRPTIIRPKRQQQTPVIEDQDSLATESKGRSYAVEDVVQDGGASVFSVSAKPQPRQSLVKIDSSEGAKPGINNDNGSGEPVYAVINKKRPTSVSKPCVSPREENAEAQIPAEGTSDGDHALPFKVKLRSTVGNKTEQEPSEDGSNRSSTDASSKAAPFLMAKPKPRPKPKPAAKPSKQESWADKIKDFDAMVSGPKKDIGPNHTRKKISPTSIKKDISSSSTEIKAGSSYTKHTISHTDVDTSSTQKDSRFDSTRTDSEIEDYEKKSSEVMASDQIVVKRPTIIRPPPKPARIAQDDDDTGNFPDITDQNKPGPPLPARRPIIKAGDGDVNNESRRHPQVSERFGSTSDKSISGPPLPARRPTSQALARDIATESSRQSKVLSTAGQSDTSNDADENKSGPPLPTRRPVSQTKDKDDFFSKLQEQQSSNKEVQNQIPNRPANAPIPRRRKSPTDISGIKVAPQTQQMPPDKEDQKPETNEQSPVSDGSRAPEPVEKRSPVLDHQDECPQRPDRPSGRPPPPKFSTTSTHNTVTKVTTVTSDASKGPPRPSGGPPRPTGPPPSPKACSPGRPSPPRSTAGKVTSKVPELPSRPSPGHALYHYMVNEPHGIAQFDYTATQDDELTFAAGETIVLESRIDASWLVGKVGDKSGMFPVEFIQIVRPLDDEMTDQTDYEDIRPPDQTWTTHEGNTAVTSGPRCIARFDYDGDGKDDLTFEENDVIRLISTMGCDWMRGELSGKEGIFPIAFVDIIEPLPDDAYRPDSFFITMESDYEGKEEQELSFKAGETIKLLGRLDDDWLIGETNTREGKFPASLVSSPLPPELPDYEPPAHLVQELEAASHHLSTQVSHSDDKPFGIALHDFAGDQDDDLSFQEGDKIELVDRVGNDWYRGRIYDKEGIFPATFVHIEKDLPESSAPKSPESYVAPDNPMDVNIEGKALFDFEGQGSEELSFKKDDIIILGQHVSEGSDWQYGTLNGKYGMFPASFVEII